MESIENKSQIRIAAYECLSALILLCFVFVISTLAQDAYEARKISDVEIAFDGSGKDETAAEQFRLLVKSKLGADYSRVRVRDALQELYQSKKIIWVKVEAEDSGAEGKNVLLRFVIKRKTQADKIFFKIIPSSSEITEQELLLKLNLLSPGTAVTDQTLQNNADNIQNYLRERGFYNAEVDFSQQAGTRDTQVNVTFQIRPNAQARIETFETNIKGFDILKLQKMLALQNGSPFSRTVLQSDVAKIRRALIGEGYLAPFLEEPKIQFDPDKNSVNVKLTGDVGAKVKVKIDSDRVKFDEKTRVKLLPIKRDGTLDQSAIIEGVRRIRGRMQEKGYFFAEIEPLCKVAPELPNDEANPLTNGTSDVCNALTSYDLSNHEVEVNYAVTPNRRFRLTDIRIEGTDKLSIPEIASVLDTQSAARLGFIPQFGYGRGYTSNELLIQDQETVKNLMQELGYRQVDVKVKQGVSPDGENLLITFVVKEGLPTRIDSVEIAGNTELSGGLLENHLPNLVGKNFSRARARSATEKLQDFYAQQGFLDARVSYSVVELLRDTDSETEKRIKLIFNVSPEGKKVFINRVLLNGNLKTENDAITRAINLRPKEVLLASDVSQSEQNLYSTGVFKGIEILAEPAGETVDGNKQRDIIINLEEDKNIQTLYAFGYSTANGANASVDLRYLNFLGKLQQFGGRIDWSQRRQLIQVDFFNPRFLPDGKNRFAPLTLTAKYQRDATVTRFFRSSIDKGTFGIVQRVDANGVPIDVFGNNTGSPTINRLTLSAETQRTISLRSRSILFGRYRFEDVRLFNIGSLLINDLLQPDRRTRISGLGLTFVRDTRENCAKKYTLLELIEKGEVTSPCRYSSTEPTNGSYLTVDYSSSLKQLGANISFNKLQVNYKTYYSISRLNKNFGDTILAANATLGIANVWNDSRFNGTQFANLSGILPISERFFAGGSDSLRGFEFEAAGPRAVIAPTGQFRDSKNNPIFLSPFTVPFGGNALAIVNLEARIPLTKIFQAVPFYDGGNVFRKPREIFNPADQTGNIFNDNLRAVWTHTIGFGVRFKTPIGGQLAIDYGYLLNPSKFTIPQLTPPNATFTLHQGQFHFRFTQAF